MPLTLRLQVGGDEPKALRKLQHQTLNSSHQTRIPNPQTVNPFETKEMGSDEPEAFHAGPLVGVFQKSISIRFIDL